MKKAFVLLLSMPLLLVSCQKIEQLYSRAFGCEVVFGTSSQHGANTKAAFSGEVSEGYERINWVANDYIKIYCEQASEPASKSHEYFVKADGITADGRKSTASLDHDPNSIGLRWGDENKLHKFAALYPAPGRGVSGTSVGNGTVTCVLPAQQSFSGSVTFSSGHHIAPVNSTYIYLAGYGTADPKAEETPVALYFDPAMTTFEFTLVNKYESGNAMTVKKAGITTAKGDLAGSYKVSVSGITASTSLTTSAIDTTGGMNSPTISMTFPTAVTVAKDDSLTLTLFTQPGNDITKLTFWLIDNDGVKRSFSFKYTDPSQGTDGWVNFTAFHKSRIRGLFTPESVGWTINTIPVVAEWSKNDKDIDIDSGSVLYFSTPVVVSWENEDLGDIPMTE